MELRPIHDQVLVELDPAEAMTATGLHIPEKARDKLPQKATVLAVGSGKVTRTGAVVPLTVKEGDRVLVDRWRGQVINDELKRLIVKEDEIVGVLEDDHADS